MKKSKSRLTYIFDGECYAVQERSTAPTALRREPKSGQAIRERNTERQEAPRTRKEKAQVEWKPPWGYLLLYALAGVGVVWIVTNIIK